MAPRIGFSWQSLRAIAIAACEGDPRLVWKKDDEGIVGIITGNGTHHQLGSLNSRQLRLLALQLKELANRRDNEALAVEVVLP